ncbi:MAG TPA: winged helix-turn-helix domain-containing protein [Nitrososphaera sp.]|jgi:predicted transcriptional regulator
MLQTTKYDVPVTGALMTPPPNKKMAVGQEFAKRDQLELLIEILNETIEPIKKTHILFRVRINYYQLTKYLGLLLKLRMIEEVSEPFEGFRIMERGKLLLQLFSTADS